MMRTLMLMTTMMLAGCTTTRKSEIATRAEPVEREAVKSLRTTLDALPPCAAGADPGVLEVHPTLCTLRACHTACCNSCGWEATLQTKNGQTIPAEKERVRQALQLPASAMECEIAAWTKLLANTSMALEPQGCVVR